MGNENKMPAPDSSKLISVIQASEISGLSTRHIRLLLGQGKLSGVKLGRDWFTTEQALENYMATDRRPGPKPKS